MARRSRNVIIGVAAVLVAVLAGACGGGGGGSSTSATTTQRGAQNRPVTVTGDPLPRFADASSDPAVGTAVPAISGQSFNGDAVKVDPGDGKAKVLLGVAHWCPHCQREVPLLSASIRAKPLPANVEMIAISTSVQPNGPNYPPQAWLEREKWPTPVMADDTNDTAANALGLSSFPYFVFVDAQGKVAARTAGEIPVSQFRSMVDQLAAGQKPTTSKS